MAVLAPGRATPLRWAQTWASAQKAPGTSGERHNHRPLHITTAILVVVVFLQRPGKLVFDTKLAMVTNPAKFMQEALHLWDPLGSFGEIQNQAYGYLFPMGPFYAFFKAIGMPMWISQRLWASLILVIGLWGAVRLGEVLDIGNDTTRLVGGLAFAVSPFVASLGSVTYGVLPNTFIPLTLIPLVSTARGEQSVIRGVARSSLAVLAMSGVNAASVLMVLPAPFLYILTRQPGPRKRKMMAWWFVGVIFATLWWIVPLLFQGKYGFNFLPYTEQSFTTNATTAAPEVLRGAGFWLAYLDVNQPWLIGGWLVSTNVFAILATIIVAGTAFFGLIHKKMKERAFFVTVLTVAVVIMCIGYSGPFHGPFNGLIGYLLDHSLAPLRNISKIEPLVALVTAMGVMHALTVVKPSRFGGDFGRLISIGRVLVCVIIGAGPFVVGNFYLTGGFSKIPHYWYQTADWIGQHAKTDNTLYVPGSAFGQYNWGNAQDEPIWSLASSPWAVRSIIPLGSKGSNLLLMQLDNIFQGGEPVPGFADFLARAGVKYIVVRNDLNDAETNAPSPLTVENILREEEGISFVKSFGGFLPSAPRPTQGFDLGLESIQSNLHEIDIYKVNQPVSMVAMYPTSTGLIVSGDPGQSILQADGAGLLGNQAVALAGDPLGPTFQDPIWIDTDGNKLRDVNFGKTNYEYSYVLEPGELSPNTGRPPRTMTMVPGVEHMTVGQMVGVSGITASSYGSAVQLLPGYQPAFAFANYPGYEWSATGANPGSWIRVQFDSSIPLSQVTITPDDSQPWRPEITQVRIDTQGGSSYCTIPLKSLPETCKVPSTFTAWMKVTITSLLPSKEQPGANGPAIEHISVPGVSVLPTMKLPSDEAHAFSAPGSPVPSYLMSSPVPDPTDFLSPPDGDPHMARLFDVPQTAAFQVSGQATPLPSKGLVDVLQGTGSVTVTASSTFSNLPWYAPSNLIETTQTGAWIAGLNDHNPSVTMSWPKKVTLHSLHVDPTSYLKGVAHVEIISVEGNRSLAVPLTGGTVAINPPLTTNRVVLTFPGNEHRPEPIGFEHLYFPDLQNLAGLAPNPFGSFALKCGTAPPLLIDGQQYPTQMNGTWGDLMSLQPVNYSVCNVPNGIQLSPGEHLLTVSDENFPFKVTALNLLGSPPPPATTTRSVSVQHWDPETREINVGTGPDAEILTLRQNYNAGWVASLNGHSLKAVRVDGWQQGYIVPAGIGGTVQLSFAPDRWYRLSLLVGLLLVLVLMGVSLSPFQEPHEDEPVGPGTVPANMLPFAGAVIAVWLVGGYLLFLVPVLVYLRWRKAHMGRVAFATLLGAGVVDALHPGKNPFAGPGPWIGLGPFSGPAQFLAVASFATVLVAILPDDLIEELVDMARRLWARFKRVRS